MILAVTSENGGYNGEEGSGRKGLVVAMTQRTVEEYIRKKDSEKRGKRWSAVFSQKCPVFKFEMSKLLTMFILY